MENSWNLFNTHNITNNTSSTINRGNQLDDNNNCTNNNAHVRPIWESRTSPRILDWSNSPVNASPTTQEEEGAVRTIMFNNDLYTSSESSPFSSYLYNRVGGGGGGGGSHSHCFPDPHLMCLKLGKRQYFGDAAVPLGDRQGAAGFSITKRGKPYYDAAAGLLVGPSTSSSAAAGVTVAATPTVVPRCQVDGCHVALLNAKDYHRRHKVCEMHSKAPKVMVLGLEQRFCQQCSRFSN